MQYADHHFIENSTFYSEISKLASTLLSQAKWYPHPLLLYKTILYSSKQQVENKKQEAVTEVKVSTKESKNVLMAAS